VKLKRLEIHNYKSLRHVVLEPAPLSVFVGPNAAGKSNLADALDFLGEVYHWDLEGAVKKKGGYENICFRQTERSSAPIRFRLMLELPFTKKDVLGFTVSPRGALTSSLDHAFELRTKSRGIKAPFFIAYEELFQSSSNGAIEFRLTRTIKRGIDVAKIQGSLREAIVSASLNRPEVQEEMKNLPETHLALLFRWFSGLRPFVDALSSLRVFQLNPRSCRETGIPTPNAALDRFGGNLPAAIDYLKSNEPHAFAQLLDAVRRVMPSLESLETDLTHTKTLGLFLKEAGVKRPWTAEDISDGTIQAIALLTATFDPRIPILVIEEPENSVHPWAIRTFVQAFREASETKQIFLTTHSPILIDQIRPEELWVVQRPELETKITPVLELDPSLKDAWGQGKFTLSEYLDSGALPAAVPAAGA